MHDCTKEEIKYLIHVESDNQGGALEYVSS